MLAKLQSGTLFHRVINNDQAFVMGVVELSEPAPDAEGSLFPFSLGENLVYLAGQRAPEKYRNSEPLEVYSMQGNLERPIWPADKQALTEAYGRWFYAMALPLEGFPKHLFIYAALPGALFDASGDSWHELASSHGKWTPIDPLCQSKGNNATSLCQQTLWPIQGSLCQIDSNPMPMQKLLQFLRVFYLEQYRSGKNTADCQAAAEAAALAEGFRRDLVNSMLRSSHMMYEQPDYMAVLDLADQIHPITERGRVLPAADYQARARSMHQAVYQLNRSGGNNA